MALRLADKQAIVAEVNKTALNALSAVVSDYRGLTVEQMTEMRAKARALPVAFRAPVRRPVKPLRPSRLK